MLLATKFQRERKEKHRGGRDHAVKACPRSIEVQAIIVGVTNCNSFGQESTTVNYTRAFEGGGGTTTVVC